MVRDERRVVGGSGFLNHGRERQHARRECAFSRIKRRVLGPGKIRDVDRGASQDAFATDDIELDEWRGVATKVNA